MGKRIHIKMAMLSRHYVRSVFKFDIFEHPDEHSVGKFIIRLQPFYGVQQQEEEKNFYTLDLSVIYTRKYPSKPPILQILHTQNLRTQNVELIKLEINQVINQKAKQNTESLQDVCLKIQDILMDLSYIRQEHIAEQKKSSLSKQSNQAADLELEQSVLQNEQQKQLQVIQEFELNDIKNLKQQLNNQWNQQSSKQNNQGKNKLEDQDQEDILLNAETGEYNLAEDVKNNSKSRYKKDFIEVSKVGRGGFGEVYKAKNKLDNLFYAIKKVSLNSKEKSVNEEILREVVLLSRLNHSNIVRFFNAWIQGDDDNQEMDRKDSDGSQSLDEEDTNFQEQSNDFEICFVDGDDNSLSRQQDKKKKKKEKKQEQSESYLEIDNSMIEFVQDSQETQQQQDEQDEQQEQEEEDDDDESDAIQFIDSDDSQKTQSDTTIQKNSSNPKITKHSKIKKSKHYKIKKGKNKSPKQQNKIQESLKLKLYIQMQFCQGSNLRDYIQDRNNDHKVEQKWKIFKQILEALHYIHSLGMIHRDLKPSNVFFDKNHNVKLGDYGLATRVKDTQIQRHHQQVSSNSRQNSVKNLHSLASYTVGVGTHHYIAPQVQIGAKYNQSADMYSLGIIFFQMWNYFSFFMERDKAIKNLRQFMKFPENFQSSSPKHVPQLIRELLSSPVERPTPLQLLQSDKLPIQVEDKQIHSLLNTVPSHRIANYVFQHKENPYYSTLTFDFSERNQI